MRMKNQKHYQIRKRVVCDLVDGECTDEQDITASVKPNCKNCREYKEWKESGLELMEYFNKYVRVDENYK